MPSSGAVAPPAVYLIAAQHVRRGGALLRSGAARQGRVGCSTTTRHRGADRVVARAVFRRRGRRGRSGASARVRGARRRRRWRWRGVGDGFCGGAAVPRRCERGRRIRGRGGRPAVDGAAIRARGGRAHRGARVDANRHGGFRIIAMVLGVPKATANDARGEQAERAENDDLATAALRRIRRTPVRDHVRARGRIAMGLRIVRRAHSIRLRSASRHRRRVATLRGAFAECRTRLRATGTTLSGLRQRERLGRGEPARRCANARGLPAGELAVELFRRRLSVVAVF